MIFLCRRKKFEGIEELLNDKDWMCRPGIQGVAVPVSHTSPCISAHSGEAFLQSSDFDAESDHFQPNLTNAEMLENNGGSPVHNDGIEGSGNITPTAEDSDNSETLQQGESHSNVLYKVFRRHYECCILVMKSLGLLDVMRRYCNSC